MFHFSLDTGINAIESAARVHEGKGIVKEDEENMYRVIRDSAIGVSDAEQWRRDWLEIEDAYCEKHFEGAEGVKHVRGKVRVGKWKYSKLLPKPWQSAKSIVGSAIEHGIPIDGVGKTALQKAVNATRRPRDPTQAFLRAIEEAHNIFNNSNYDIREAMKSIVTKTFHIGE